MIRLATLTALAAALTAYATEPAHAADPAPLVLVQTIPLKGVVGNLDHLAVDARGGRLFVANKANNTLDVVDLKTGTLVKQIPDQTKVSGVVYARDLDMIFVGNGGGVCNAIDGKEYKTVFSTKAEKADNVLPLGHQDGLRRPRRHGLGPRCQNGRGEEPDCHGRQDRGIPGR